MSECPPSGSPSGSPSGPLGGIAIVGGGFSGTALAERLAAAGRGDIHLIERTGRFGPGVAYGTRDPDHLLNVRAARMGAREDDPAGFARWAGEQAGPGFHPGSDPAAFMPRALYGAYLEERAAALPAARVRRWEGAAEQLTPLPGGGWRVSLGEGRQLTVARLVLATGVGVPRWPEVLAAAVEAAAAFPWRAVSAWDWPGLAALEAQAEGREVLIVGTGLSAVDAALSLAHHARARHIWMLSRHGRLPQPHLPGEPVRCDASHDAPLVLPEASGVRPTLAWLRRTVGAAAAAGQPWQEVMERLRPDNQRLWQRFSLAERRRFLRHGKVWWDMHRHRVPSQLARHLADLQAQGRLTVLAGSLTEAAFADGRFRIVWRPRGTGERRTLGVDALVNATGRADPLADEAILAQLVRERWVQPCPLGLGLATDDAHRVLAPNGRPAPGLYALGALCAGHLWEITAVPDIRRQVAALATALSSDAAPL